MPFIRDGFLKDPELKMVNTSSPNFQHSSKAFLKKGQKKVDEICVRREKWQNVLPMFYVCSKIKIPDLLKSPVSLVAGAGFEPTTFGL